MFFCACGTPVKLKHLEMLWIEGEPTQPLTEPLQREAVPTEIIYCPDSIAGHVAICLEALVVRAGKKSFK